MPESLRKLSASRSGKPLFITVLGGSRGGNRTSASRSRKHLLTFLPYAGLPTNHHPMPRSAATQPLRVFGFAPGLPATVLGGGAQAATGFSERMMTRKSTSPRRG